MFGFLKRRKHNREEPPREEEQREEEAQQQEEQPAQSSESKVIDTPERAPETRQSPAHERQATSASEAGTPSAPETGEARSENEPSAAAAVTDSQPVDTEETPRPSARTGALPEAPAEIETPEPAPGMTATPEDMAASADMGDATETTISPGETALRPGERRRGRPAPDEIEIGPETADDADSGGRKQGWFRRMRQGLGKTRANLTDNLATLLLGHKEIDDDLLEELETQLLLADVGVEATTEIMTRLEERISRRELKNVEALYQALQEELSRMLEPVAKTLKLPPKGEGPFVILMVGVNGVGKTTTIGKLTQRYQRQGRSVMLAAGDTFRAAAVEQLKVWGERNEVPVIAQHTGADSASVIYDAVSAAKARGIDVLIADTAGRLQNKGPLMEELRKVQRVMARLDEHAPHEVMLVLDAGTGQNAISQAETFHEAVPITGITLTKLDGTAKGGIIFAVAKQLGIPIRYIGVGETLDDLRPFEAQDFVGALFDRDNS